MPMDIRNFFSKASPKAQSSNDKPESKKAPNAASTSSSAKRQPKKTAAKSTSSKVATKTRIDPSKKTRRSISEKETTTSSAQQVNRRGNAASASNSSAAVVKSKATVAPEEVSAPTKNTKNKSNSSNSSSNNNNNNNSKMKQQQPISIDTDEDDERDNVISPTALKQPPSSTRTKKASRVIVDDSDEDDEAKDEEMASPPPKLKAPSPAKKTNLAATTSNKGKHPVLRTDQSAKTSEPEQSIRKSRRSTSSSMQLDTSQQVEVSAEDFFGASSAKTKTVPLTNEKPKASPPMRKVKDEMHESEDDDDDENFVVTKGKGDDEDDDDESFLVNNGDDVNDDDHTFDDDDTSVDHDKGKSKNVKSHSTTRRRSTKRKMHTDDDDDESLDAGSKPPPRKSPRKQQASVALVKPKEILEASSKPPPSSHKLAKKMSRTTTSLSTTKPVALAPLEPGFQLDSFDPDAVVASECLAGTTFVFSGIMANVSRDEAQELVKVLGGRVTNAVSNKTTYLVLGDILEDGREVTEGKKYKTAMEKGVRLVQGEKELYGLAKLYHDRAVEQHQKQQGFAHPTKAAAETKKSPPLVSGKISTAQLIPGDVVQGGSVDVEKKNIKQAPSAQAPVTTKVDVKPPAPAVFNPYAKKVSNPYASQKPKTSSISSQFATDETVVSSDVDLSNRLWADKYAPQVSQEVLGNKDSVDKLAKWLQRWETTFSGHSKVKVSDSGPKKAALLSGPPGIGKTTTANLVAKEAGRDILEFNASDVRSKKALQNDLGDVTGSQSINFAPAGKKGKGQNAARKRVLIMDEVDGMGAGDRNGMAELIKMIKLSRVPIICICNDRQSQKIRSLVPYCLDLRFRRPSKSVIANRAIKVASMEGLQVERNAAETIAESCGNDVRQVLNCLQMWASQGNDQDRMTYKDLKERENFINKDDILRVNIFDATKMIVEGRKGLNDADMKAEVDSFYKRNDAFFVDYSLMGLNVQQNYLKVMMAPFNDAKRTADQDSVVSFLDRMHEATHAMSDFAVVEREIRGGDMNWSLLPFAGVMTVKTGFHAGGESGSFFPGFPDFPAWMGKNSTKGKKTRILQELSYHMNYKVSGGRNELRLSYVPTLRDRLYSMIASADESETTSAINLMDDYGLDRDDVFEKLDEFKIDSKIDFSKIEGKAKAAFTREYNSASHKSQALVAEQGGGSKRKRGGGATSNGEKDPADLDAIDEDVAVEQQESDGDAEEEDFEKIKKIFGKSKGGRKSGGGQGASKKGSGPQKKRTKK